MTAKTVDRGACRKAASKLAEAAPHAFDRFYRNLSSVACV